MPLSVRVLGGLQIEREGRPLQGFVSARARALLAYLAVTGQRHRREALADLLWGEWPEASARRSLRQVLFNLRQIIGPGLLITRDTVQLPHDARLSLDLAPFLAQSLVAPGALSIAQLRATVALYHGDFLAGFDLGDAPAFEAWVTTQRESLLALVVRALAALNAQAQARQNWAVAIDALERLLALEPWREDIHRQLMRALAASGQRDAALAHYRVCCRALAVELDAAPSAETVALYQKLASGVAATPSNRARPTPLPASTTALVGREAERATLAARLAAPHCRLLTLLGPGGVGKTRLSLAVANTFAATGEVCFVDLSAVTEPDLVAPAIVKALGLAQIAAQPILNLLRDALFDRQLVLVLDNCERIIRAAPLVADLLANCPELTILATSRVPFHIRGEQEYQVAPLALPASGQEGDRAAVDAAPAVQLFVARARDVRPNFAITAANAATVAAICAEVDGLPLAIELAAAWLKYLPPATILERLHDRLGLLSNGPRDVPERQQTLRAAIAWSEDLLEAEQRRLFRQLGVFAGGATAQAIAAVCGVTPAAGLFAGLVALIDQSLLSQVDRYDSRAELWVSRFGMLATIRDYALARLADEGELVVARRRHAQTFLQLAEEAGRDLSGAGQLAALERLDAERDNLRAALDAALRGPEDPALRLLGLRLVGALWRYWEVRGELSEGRHWLARALRASEQGLDDVDPTWRAGAHLGAGVLAKWQADYPAASAHLSHALALAREAGDRAGVAAACAALGEVAMARGEYQQAHASHSAAIAEALACGAWSTLAPAFVARASVEAYLANYDAAVDDLHEALALTRKLGDRRGSATALHRLARVRRDQGDLAASRACAEESLALQRDINDRWALAYALNALGNVARDQGSLEEATTYLTECLDLQRRLGDRQGAGYTQHQLGIIARRRGDFAAAQALGEEALALFRELGHRRGIGYATLALAQTARAQGGAGVWALLQESLVVQHELGDKRGIAAALAEYVALLLLDDPLTAARLHGAITALREQSGITPIPSTLAEEVRQRATLGAALTAEGYGRACVEGAAWALGDLVASLPLLARQGPCSALPRRIG